MFQRLQFWMFMGHVTRDLDGAREIAERIRGPGLVPAHVRGSPLRRPSSISETEGQYAMEMVRELVLRPEGAWLVRPAASFARCEAG